MLDISECGHANLNRFDILFQDYIFSVSDSGCLFQDLTKRFGRGMHEWAAKVDEYARGLLGPPGSTLFEELGLYYIGPVDGHNIEDLICVLREVASLDSMGPVLVHVITKEDHDVEVKQNQTKEASNSSQEGMLEYVFSFSLLLCFMINN